MAEATTLSSNKRIAKNTFFLYIRMFVLLVLGLFTARITLEALGEEDYGIYNIIGGVVVLFSFLNQALTAATQRFLNFHLGKNEHDMVHKVFCMSMNSYIILSGIFLILAETIGLLFVNTQLNIPSDRMYAANWVYQFTIVTFIIQLLRIPYNAIIIAHERMHFFAYISIVETGLKLGVVYALFIHGVDRLILYSALYTAFPFLINLIFKQYCNKHFHVSKFHLFWDWGMFNKLFSFSGWSLFGSLASMLAHQGINILVNIFFGVTVNAAVGIANNVTSHVTQFVTNFQTAFQPQVVKRYAAEQFNELYDLIFTSSKFSYYLMFVLSLPIILTTQTLLGLWLVEVPKFTAIFCQLSLGYMLIEALSGPLWMSIQATGRIKSYQILMASCIFLNFPLTYAVYKLGLPVYSAWIIRIGVNIVAFVIRCVYMQRQMKFNVAKYGEKVILPVFIVTIASIPIPLLIKTFAPNNIIVFFLVLTASLVSSFFSIFIFGITASEKHVFLKVITTKFIHKKSNFR